MDGAKDSNVVHRGIDASSLRRLKNDSLLVRQHSPMRPGVRQLRSDSM